MRRCGKCDFVNTDNAKFCSQCGNDLDAEKKELRRENIDLLLATLIFIAAGYFFVLLSIFWVCDKLLKIYPSVSNDTWPYLISIIGGIFGLFRAASCIKE